MPESLSKARRPPVRRRFRRRFGIVAAVLGTSVLFVLSYLAVPAEPISSGIAHRPARASFAASTTTSNQSPGTSSAPPTSSAVGADTGVGSRAGEAADDATRLGITRQSADHQSELVRREAARVVMAKLARLFRSKGQEAITPFQVRGDGLPTLVLTARDTPYTLDDLQRLAPEGLVQESEGTYLLHQHVLVGPGARLAIRPTSPTTIKLVSEARGFASIVVDGGRLHLLGTTTAPLTVTSWDTASKRADTNLDDGRAYVLVRGQLIARKTTFARLGFWSGPTGGVAMIGTQLQQARLDPKAKAKAAAAAGRPLPAPSPAAGTGKAAPADPSPGEISDCRMDHNSFGLFVSSAAGTRISRVVITASQVSGLVLHRGVTAARVDAVSAIGSGLDGIVLARGVESATISRSTVTDNGRDGIVVAGSPFATGPSPGGASIRPFGGNVLSANTVERNRRTGILLNGGTDLRVTGNTISGGRAGILVTHGASKVTVDHNHVAQVGMNAIQVRRASGVDIAGNTVQRTATGIHVSAARVTVRDNNISTATLHALSFVGDVRNSSARDNSFGGSGSSAIDTTRSAPGAGPVLGHNDLTRWQRRPTVDGVLGLLAHPMTLVWLAIGVTMVATLRFRRHTPGQTRAYPDSPPLAASSVAIEIDQAAARAAVADDRPWGDLVSRSRRQRERTL